MELGYGREVVEENDEIDLGLAELNAQKKRRDTRPLWADRGVMWRLPERGAPHASGELFDMWELWLRARGKKGHSGRLKGAAA